MQILKPAILTACALILCACGSALEKVPAPEPLLLIDDLPKWERVYYAEQVAPTFNGANALTQNLVAARAWTSLYRHYHNAELMAKIKAVNVFFNNWPCVQDRDNWNLEDYWATPAEFMERAGDCEDYAIAKYYALKALGVPPDEMCIAVVWNLRRREGHAVLLVKVAGEYYMLDNLQKTVVPAKNASHYAPYFYINDGAAWLHTKMP